MSLAWNIRKYHNRQSSKTNEQFDSSLVEYHLLSRRELYDKSIITVDRYSSGAGEWVISSKKDYYQVIVLSRPYYILPQRLCLSFDCFVKEVKSNYENRSFHSIDLPIDRVAIEFTSLLSVFAREPIVPIGNRRINDTPTFGETHELFPSGLVRDRPPPPCGINSSELISILNGFVNVSDELIQAIIGATKFYYAGLSLITFDRSVAYTSLVSAIECLAGYHHKGLRFHFDEIPKYANAKNVLDQLEVLNGASPLVEEIKQKIVRSDRFLLKKFSQFILDHTPDEFWTIPDELYKFESIFPEIIKEDFEKYLKLIYNSRSKYLHGGSPFPLYVEFGIRPTIPSESMKDLFELKGKPKFLPPFAWFERLTHYVIIEFMKQSLAPVLIDEIEEKNIEKQRLLSIISELQENVLSSLKTLTHKTESFLPFARVY